MTFISNSFGVFELLILLFDDRGTVRFEFSFEFGILSTTRICFGIQVISVFFLNQ